jgi:hypothetical protein
LEVHNGISMLNEYIAIKAAQDDRFAYNSHYLSSNIVPNKLVESITLIAHLDIVPKPPKADALARVPLQHIKPKGYHDRADRGKGIDNKMNHDFVLATTCRVRLKLRRRTVKDVMNFSNALFRV